jgi:hypothetical protein
MGGETEGLGRPLTEAEQKILDGFGLHEDDTILKHYEDGPDSRTICTGEWIICACCGAALFFRSQWPSQDKGTWCQACSRPLAMPDPRSLNNEESSDEGIQHSEV